MTSRPYRMAVLSFVLGLAYFGSFVGYGINLEDEGALVSQMSRFADGDRLYEDFHIGYTPGVYLLHGAIMKLSGHSLIAGRWVLATTMASTMALLYLLGWQISHRKWLALVPPLLYLASIPIHPGNFVSSNIPYPVWYNVLLWAAGMLALHAFGRGKGLRWLLVAGLLAGVNFAFKPNVGLFQLAASSLLVLAVIPLQSQGESPWRDRFNHLLWWAWWLSILGGLAVVFAGRAGVREFWLLLAPAVVAALLVAWRAAVVPPLAGRTPSVSASAATLALSFIAVNAPWMVYYFRTLGTQRFLERALFFGADFEKFYFISHPPVLMGIIAGLLVITATVVIPRRLARLGIPTDLFLLAAAVTGTVTVGLFLAGRPMPEGFYAAVMTRVEPGAFPLVILAHWLGLWMWARSIGKSEANRRPSFDAALLTIGAIFLYMQIYPRTDFMHWVTSAPVSLVLVVVLLSELAQRWQISRSRWLPSSTVAAVFLIPLLAVGALRVGYSLSASFDFDGILPTRPPSVRLESDRAPIWSNVGVAAGYHDLSALVDFIKTNTSEDETIFTFPSLDVVSFLSGRHNTTRHGYFFPGWPGREVEAEVISDLDASPPRFVVVYYWHPLFFSRAGLYYFQLHHYIEANYRPYARFGRYAVLSHRSLGPTGQGPDMLRSTVEAALSWDLDQDLKSRLANADPEVRLRAIDLLVSFELGSEYPPLSRLLNDPRQDIRDRVVWAYRNVHDEKVATQLVDATALQALSPRESLLALRVIGGGVGDDAAPGLISLVNSSDVAVAGAATRALFLVASRRLNSSFWFGYTREKVPGLVDDTDLVQITQWIDHDSAARGLRYFGVVSAMSMPRESVCRTALNNISHNADIALRLLALRALAAHGCVPDLDILESAYRLMLFDDRMTMRLAEDVLRNRDDADELLADMIHRADGAKLESSVWLASVYGGQQSAAELVALVGHENPDVRVAAVWALGRTGSINHADHLELARLDPDADVSEMADRAMGMLHRRLN